MKWFRRILIPVLILGVIAGAAVSAFSKSLALRRYALKSAKATQPFRVVLITDLHCTLYGENQEELAAAIRVQNPQAVLMSGDIADDVRPPEGTERLLRQIAQEFPCFYVSGNHEYWSGNITALKEMFRSYGVEVLEGGTRVLELNGQRVSVSGIDDPDGDRDEWSDGNPPWREQLQKCREEKLEDAYSILLSHRPERVAEYTACDFDLILSGHAHGGQVRLPLLMNGLYAPNQGWFPEYAGGKYLLGNPRRTVMIVSRGLMRDKLPRIFNPPELVVIDVQPE